MLEDLSRDEVWSQYLSRNVFDSALELIDSVKDFPDIERISH